MVEIIITITITIINTIIYNLKIKLIVQQVLAVLYVMPSRLFPSVVKIGQAVNLAIFIKG